MGGTSKVILRNIVPLNDKNMNKSRSDFRHDINALRAIAVLGVVLFHYKVPYFDGGFAGVDIFFVISGYLMTKIITKSLLEGNFSLSNFYSRRATRILPALIFLVLVITCIGYFIYLPIGFKELTKNAAASVAFISNFVYYKRDYFDASSDTNMFLHTWSLSVEWQFYMLLPLLFMLLNHFWRITRRGLGIVLFAATIILFIFSVVAQKIWPNASFYLFPTRSWEMLAGGVAFLSEGYFKQLKTKSYVVLGYLGLFLSLTLLHAQLPWPGFWTLAPVLSTFIIIVGNENKPVIIQNPVVQFIGNISYSFYLWHWPVYVMGGYLGFVENSISTIALIALSGCLALISYKYVESQMANNIRLVLVAACIAIAFPLGLSFIIKNNFLFSNDSLRISQYGETHLKERESQFNASNCFTSSIYSNYNKAQCLKIVDGKQNYLLLGDSHSAHLSQSLRNSFDALGINLNQASSSGCMPLLNQGGQKRCTELMDYIFFEYLPQNANVLNGVIISANWIDSKNQNLIEDLKTTTEYLTKLGIRYILIGQNETYLLPYPIIAAREYEERIKFSEKFLNVKSRKVNELLKSSFGKYYIDIYQLSLIPKLSKDKAPYMFDENHFTKYGADLVSNVILQRKQFKDFLNLGK